MNKAQLVDEIASAMDLPKAVATKTIDCVLSNIIKSLTTGEDVALAGLGTFTIKNRAARDGRNPKTGDKIRIAASKKVAFAPSKTLKDAVNN